LTPSDTSKITKGSTTAPEDRAEMYVGEDVSPDFYAWVFPKSDHVAVGTGTVVDKKGIQKYQQGIRDRAATRIEGGDIIRQRGSNNGQTWSKSFWENDLILCPATLVHN